MNLKEILKDDISQTQTILCSLYVTYTREIIIRKQVSGCLILVTSVEG